MRNIAGGSQINIMIWSKMRTARVLTRKYQPSLNQQRNTSRRMQIRNRSSPNIPGIAHQISSIQEEFSHWKPKVFDLLKNRTGIQFVKTLVVIFLALIDKDQFSHKALKAAMVMPHLILARTKDKNDGSLSEMLSSRINLWVNSDFGNIFHEVNALQTSNRKMTSTKKHYCCKGFDNQMTPRRISSALGCLDPNQKGRILPLNDKVKGWRVIEILPKNSWTSKLSKRNYRQGWNLEHSHASRPLSRNQKVDASVGHQWKSVVAMDHADSMLKNGNVFPLVFNSPPLTASLFATIEIETENWTAYKTCHLIPP